MKKIILSMTALLLIGTVSQAKTTHISNCNVEVLSVIEKKEYDNNKGFNKDSKFYIEYVDTEGKTNVDGFDA
ncbi:MAG: hypothetical protein ACRCVU_13070, partial [Flavobacterium sp.]